MYKRGGFTIIEIMIFIGITGLMIALLLTNSGSSLDMQRYRDTILSLQTFLQDQYSETISVRNNITGTFSCSISNTNSLTITTGDKMKGQSDCLLVGKYLKTSDNTGTTIDAYAVLAQKKACIDCKSDLDALKNDYLVADDSTNATNLKTTHKLLWGANMLKPDDKSANLQFSMAILKSPTSGNVYTLISPTSVSNIQSLLTLSNSINSDNSIKQDLVICVDKRNLNVRKNMGIRILANSIGPTGVSYLGDGDNSTGGCT